VQIRKIRGDNEHVIIRWWQEEIEIVKVYYNRLDEIGVYGVYEKISKKYNCIVNPVTNSMQRRLLTK
jgi:hypothetical protein